MKHNKAPCYKDIRYIQIAFMGVLFSYGVLVFDLSLLWAQVVLTFTSGLLTQFFWKNKLYRTGQEFMYSALCSLFGRSLQKPKNSNTISIYRTSIKNALFRAFLPEEKEKQPENTNQTGINFSGGYFLSAVITCLSLVLLLRSDNLWIHPLASFIAISSKFCIQYNKQHFFNPSAFGIFVVLFLGEAWLSPGQWGSHVSLSIWMVAVGCFIVTKVHRMDISWLFLLFYLGGLLIRDVYLGYEMAVFYHAALNGSLLLFAFFMISDPRTSPNHFVGKMIFTFFVAFISLVLHYYFYIQNGLIYSLIACSCFIPLLNKKFQARPFQWNKEKTDDGKTQTRLVYFLKLKEGR